MDDPVCWQLAERIADLEQQVEALRDLLSDPELTPAQRGRVRLQITQTQGRISELRGQLAACRGRITIAGVEKTQGTQFFAFNGQGSGYRPDNSVPLIAQRTLILRVYVDCKLAQQGPLEPQRFPTYVSGRVVVDRVQSNGSLTRLATLTPINGSIAGRRAEAIDRGDPNHTLNFRVRSNDCQGLLRFTITVFEQGPVVVEQGPVVVDDVGFAAAALPASSRPAPVSSAEVAATSSPFTLQAYARFEPMPAFRVHAILVHYTGDGQDHPAPSGFEFAETLEYVLRTYPIGRLEFEDCVEIDFDKNLETQGGGCGPGWEGEGGLMEILREIDDNSDRPAIRVALIPEDVDTSVGGCGNKNIAAASVGDGDTLAQEMGHALDRKHAPAGPVGGPDPNYPDYDGYPSGSIGEYGFDVVTSEVYDPNNSFDFMSYGGNRWVSPYTYMGLRNTIIERFGQASARMRTTFGRRGSARRQEMLFLSFTVARDGTVEVHPSFHLPVARQEIVHGTLSDISCELLDERGNVLSARHCRLRGPEVDARDARIDFHEAIPWSDRAAAVRFLRGRDALGTHQIEERAPAVALQTPEIRAAGRSVSLAWEGEHPERDLTYLVRYSCDGGESWRVLAVSSAKPEYVTRDLPGGEHCLVQIVATSGVRTAVAESKPFSVPKKPRRAEILRPVSVNSGSQGHATLLRGAAFSSDYGLGEPDDVVWNSNVDGFLGRGFELIADGLSEGLHTITLSAPDGQEGMATASTTMRVSGPAA